MQQEREPWSEKELIPTIENLREHVYLVHATNYYPRDGIIKAKAARKDKTQTKNASLYTLGASFRPTIHFSLGEMFKEDGGTFSVDKARYAVVATLPSLEKQLLSVFPNDTSVLGDIDITKNPDSFTLFVPEGEAVVSTPGVIVEHYNPAEESLRDAVSRFLVSRKAWQFKTDTFVDAPHYFASKTKIKNKDIHNHFFHSLVEQNPHLSLGTHFHSFEGEAWRFGVTDFLLRDTVYTYITQQPEKLGKRDLHLRVLVLSTLLKGIEKYIKESNYTAEIKSAYEKELLQAKHWLQLLEYDLELMSQVHKTFMNSPELGEEIFSAIQAGEKYSHFSEDTRLQDAPRDSLIENSELKSLGNYLANLPHNEIEPLFESSQLTDQERKLFQLIYATTRWMLLGHKNGRAENIDSQILEILTEKKVYAEYFFEYISDFLSPKCSSLENALLLLNDAKIKKTLNTLMDWDLPDKELTFKELLQLHPDTSALWEKETVFLDEIDPEIYTFLVKAYIINPTTLKPDLDQDLSFNGAKTQLYLRKNAEKNLIEYSKTIQTPLKGMTVSSEESLDLWGKKIHYYQTIRSNYASPQSYWQKLFGLGEAYKAHFTNDEDFFESAMSLFEIYKMLSGIRD